MNEKYNNSGALFRNERKMTDKHPEYTGSITVDGIEYWLSGWLKEGQRGKFFSLAVKRKEAKPTRTQPTQRPAPAADNEPDDVPF